MIVGHVSWNRMKVESQRLQVLYDTRHARVWPFFEERHESVELYKKQPVFHSARLDAHA